MFKLVQPSFVIATAVKKVKITKNDQFPNFIKNKTNTPMKTPEWDIVYTLQVHFHFVMFDFLSSSFLITVGLDGISYL